MGGDSARAAERSGKQLARPGRRWEQPPASGANLPAGSTLLECWIRRRGRRRWHVRGSACCAALARRCCCVARADPAPALSSPLPRCRYVEGEKTNGRWAMAAVAGILFTDLLGKGNWFEAGAQVQRGRAGRGSASCGAWRVACNGILSFAWPEQYALAGGAAEADGEQEAAGCWRGVALTRCTSQSDPELVRRREWLAAVWQQQRRARRRADGQPHGVEPQPRSWNARGMAAAALASPQPPSSGGSSSASQPSRTTTRAHVCPHSHCAALSCSAVTLAGVLAAQQRAAGH